MIDLLERHAGWLITVAVTLAGFFGFVARVSGKIKAAELAMKDLRDWAKEAKAREDGLELRMSGAEKLQLIMGSELTEHRRTVERMLLASTDCQRRREHIEEKISQELQSLNKTMAAFGAVLERLEDERRGPR